MLRWLPFVVLLSVIPFERASSTDDASAIGLCHGTVESVVYTSADEIAAGRLGMLHPIAVVDIPAPSDIDFTADPPVDDPSWTLYWYGLMWLMPLAVDPAHHEVAIQYALAWQDQTRDTDATGRGWDEGTNLRRLESLLCIRSRTESTLLDETIERSIEVAKDPGRYPNVPWPNNHVIMINKLLINAGALLDRPDLVEFGLDRLANDWRVVWAPPVFDLEQASAYVAVNISMWLSVADVFDAYGRDAEAAALRDRLDIARRGLRLLMTPDGRLVPFGDSSPTIPDASVILDGGALTLVDPVAGIAAGRTSWDDDATHWTIRFGPPRIDNDHGHIDALAVSWAAEGENVLVDPGQYSYGRNDHADWDHNPPAHNVALPLGPGATFIPGTVSPLRDHGDDDVRAWFSLMTIQYGVPQTRTINIFREHPVIVVIDEARGPLVQAWHLDPAWTPTEGGWETSDGSALRMSSTADSVDRFSGEPRGGWVFPAFRDAVPAEQVMASGQDHITTAWILGDAEVQLTPSTVTIDGVTYDLLTSPAETVP